MPNIALWTAILALIAGGSAMAQPAVLPARHEIVVRQSPKGEVRLGVTIRGQGPVVLLIPSLGRGAADFDDLATRLADAGYEAAAIDPRGVGDSAGPMQGLTMADFADDVAAVAARLSPGPVVLVGHAFGNRVARATAAAHPAQVSALVLLAAGGQVKIAPDIAKALNDVFEPLYPESHHAAVAKAFFASGNDASVWDGGWYKPTKEAQMAALRATGPETWTGAGSAPILIIQARDDVVAP
ncbi:MAG TPA: alpha/beta hydrolase, partial [Caulobacteraceae bacterium]|nr:alpha/beta hydrolase [Caulobacteraceae bacterium]